MSEDKIRHWLATNLGEVIDLAPLPGWRPAWNGTVRTANGALPVHVRGERPAGLETQPLKQEYHTFRLLAEHGLPVPAIHGWCDDPEAIVMQRMDDHPFLGGAHEDSALHAVVGEYVAHMAEIHRIPLERAMATGLPRPGTAREIALAYFKDNDGYYLAHKSGPEPMMEFVRGWIARNIPEHRSDLALLVGDAPQFFHNGRKVTAIYDLELAYIGDPMADLASLRVRDINEPIGGIDALLQRYVRESGRAIDWPALDFHTIACFLAVPLRVGAVLKTQAGTPAYIEYMSWYLAAARGALEVLADVLGVRPEPVPPLAMAATDRSVVLRNLVDTCAELPAATGRLREHPARSLAHYLWRLDGVGAEIARLEKTEAEAILGTTHGTAEATEAALEHFVQTAGAEHDADLTALFHRRILRRLQLIQDYPAPIVGRAPTPVDRSFR